MYCGGVRVVVVVVIVCSSDVIFASPYFDCLCLYYLTGE